MTANETDPTPEPSARRRSSETSASVGDSPTSTSTGPIGAAANVSPWPMPPKVRSLPPPLGPRLPTSPGTAHRTAYTMSKDFKSPTRVPMSSHRASSSNSAIPAGTQTVAGVAPVSSELAAGADLDNTAKEDPQPGPTQTQPEVEPLPDYSYRSPEAVVEHVEDSWTSHLPPGVLAEHFNEDDGGWAANNKGKPNTPAYDMWMDVDESVPQYTPEVVETVERPFLGPGQNVKLWLANLHEHELYRPTISALPHPLAKSSPKVQPKPPVRSMSAMSENDGHAAELPPVAPESLTMDDVLDALPGGRDDYQNWYFCTDCWAWFHVLKGDVLNPSIPSMDEWQRSMSSSFDTNERLLQACGTRQEEMSRYRDLLSTRETITYNDLPHLHPFFDMIPTTTETRIERVDVEGHVDKFVHLEVDDAPDRYKASTAPSEDARLWMSCTSNHWVFVDKGPVLGQLPKRLVADFTAEKQGNPGPGQTPLDSSIAAWQLVNTLLINPLFKGQRGWVKMSNPTFQNKIGASLTSSHLLYQMGFACNEREGEGYVVGPFTKNEQVTEDNVRQMNRYMARTWVEVSLALQMFQKTRGVSITANEFIQGKSLQQELGEWLGTAKLPTLALKFEPKYAPSLEALGVTDSDVVQSVSKAYDQQVSDDQRNISIYLSALEKLSHAAVDGTEALQIKVATERSLGRYTKEDLDAAYQRLGLTQEYVKGVLLDDVNDLSTDWVLDEHRKAMERAADSAARAEIMQALRVIGRARKDPRMLQISNGGVYLSLPQAYSEFNITPDSNIDDELLIMQYETWISDRPSRADHYRHALSVIADAPGQERPVLQAFLQGKDISELQPVARRDIPTGLRNIGNTCYLNSVLQFLYTIKPIREAVMTFEELSPSVPDPDETEKEMEKRVKTQSSRRFVGLLRELFNDMYTTSERAVVPKEELARLAILPVDLVGERKEALPQLAIPQNRVTIDSIPEALSPDSTTISSGAATAADSRRTTSPPSTPPDCSPAVSPTRRASILGKRSSHDRESAFGGSEERLRRLTNASDKDLIVLDSTGEGLPDATQSDVDMEPRSSSAREDSEMPSTSLSQLGITSPLQEVGTVSEVPAMQSATSGSTPGPLPAPMGPPPLPPRRRHSTALVAAEKFGLQQDAAEILINVLAQLEYAVETPEEKDTPSKNLISSLFSAKFRQQMILKSADGSETESPAPVDSVFVHPIIGVEEDGKDLYDCLAELYLGGAEIEYEGKKGYKMDLIDELPPMLYIQMRRSQYDYALRRQTKTNTHIPFDRTLVMDRFLSGADADKRERSIALTREMMRLRARRHELKNHKPLSIPETFRFVRDALSADDTMSALGFKRDEAALVDLENDDVLPTSMLDSLGDQAIATESEISQLETKLPIAKKELEELWDGQKQVEYELVSVFVHGGTGTGGHYWTYQANLPTDGNKFFYYSDETVKEVEAEEVFADKSAKGVAPALLCYVRKDRNLVDTLHREAEPVIDLTGGDDDTPSHTYADSERSDVIAMPQDVMAPQPVTRVSGAFMALA